MTKVPTSFSLKVARHMKKRRKNTQTNCTSESTTLAYLLTVYHLREQNKRLNYLKKSKHKQSWVSKWVKNEQGKAVKKIWKHMPLDWRNRIQWTIFIRLLKLVNTRIWFTLNTLQIVKWLPDGISSLKLRYQYNLETRSYVNEWRNTWCHNQMPQKL